MPSIDLDFGSVGKVPEGWFRLNIDKAVFKANKSKDGYIINLQMHLVDMPEEFEQFENMQVFDNASMKLSARKFLKNKLSAITQKDWSEDGMQLETVCDVCEEEKCSHDKRVPELEDQTVIGLIYGEEYQGDINARVRRWLPDDGSVELGTDMTE